MQLLDKGPRDSDSALSEASTRGGWREGRGKRRSATAVKVGWVRREEMGSRVTVGSCSK